MQHPDFVGGFRAWITVKEAVDGDDADDCYRAPVRHNPEQEPLESTSSFVSKDVEAAPQHSSPPRDEENGNK